MRRIYTVLCALIWATSPVMAQDPPSNVTVLRGLGPVRVVFEDISNATAARIDTSNLRVRFELELRRSGVVVKESAIPYLYVNISLIQMASVSGWSYSYDLALQEPVTIQRPSNSSMVMAATWSTGGVGYAGNNVVKGAINDAIETMVNRFLNDYLSANPPSR